MPPRPPLPNSVKLEVNWQNGAGNQAHNICYALFATSVDTTDPTLLGEVAHALFHAFTISGAGVMPFIAPQWSLLNVTCSDNGGTSDAQATNTDGPESGTGPSASLPPQCAVALSWEIAARYRGGKPRWYLPGIPQGSTVTAGSPQLLASYANNLESAATALLSSFNSSDPGGNVISLGTMSFQTAHTPRVTPLFRQFGGVHVHQRMDSQRRRSGKESAFPVS